MSIPSGNVTYTYDDLNRPETVIDPATGTTTYTGACPDPSTSLRTEGTCRRDNVGNLKTVTYPNGTIAEYTYDDLNRLTYLENRTSNGILISSYSYTLDDAGNRTKVVEHTGRTVEYTYDDTYKLLEEKITNPDTSVSVISDTHDKVGNRLTKTENGFTTTYQYDANNRLVQEDDVRYSYDDNGNVIEKDSPDEQVVYVYDFENHLIRAETTALGTTIVVEYAYDALGNRVRKTIDGLVTTTYLVDENRDYAQVLEERDGDGNLLVRYVYGHDLISQTRGGATTYYHYDGLGSTRALTNNSQGVYDTYNYDAFGNLLDRTGATPNTHLYTGEFFDMNLGFYYLRARYMNPAVGRFVTMDTFAGRNRDPYSLHKYLYVHANPITYLDPSGYLSETTELNVRTQIDMEVRATGARITHGVTIPLYKKVLIRLFLLGLTMAPASTFVGDIILDAVKSNDSVSPGELVSILARTQALLQIKYNLEEENDSGGKTFYRGLKDKDVEEFYDLGMILSKGLRAAGGITERIVSGDPNWIRIILEGQLKNFDEVSKHHKLVDSEGSHFVSITTAFWVAREAAHWDTSSSGKVLIVNTTRAIENLHCQGMAEWLVPLLIVRDVETVGDPFDVEPLW